MLCPKVVHDLLKHLFEAFLYLLFLGFLALVLLAVLRLLVWPWSLLLLLYPGLGGKCHDHQLVHLLVLQVRVLWVFTGL